MARLVNRIQTDPLTRVRLISRFAETLIDLGADPADLEFVSSFSPVPVSKKLGDQEDGPETEGADASAGLVFISTRDAARNSQSFIVG